MGNDNYGRRPQKIVNDIAARVAAAANGPDDMLLTTAEVSALSGFAEVTLRLWRRQGRGPSWLEIEGMPRLRLGDYRKWLAEQKRG